MIESSLRRDHGWSTHYAFAAQRSMSTNKRRNSRWKHCPITRAKNAVSIYQVVETLTRIRRTDRTFMRKMTNELGTQQGSDSLIVVDSDLRKQHQQKCAYMPVVPIQTGQVKKIDEGSYIDRHHCNNRTILLANCRWIDKTDCPWRVELWQWQVGRSRATYSLIWLWTNAMLSLIHIWRCRRRG